MRKTSIRILISATLLAWIASRTEWAKVGDAFAALRVELWLAAVGLLLVSQFLGTWRWQQLARALGSDRPLRELFAYYLVGAYFNLTLPTATGGDVVRAWYLDRRPGHRLHAFVSVVLDRLCGLIMLVALAAAGTLFAPAGTPRWLLQCVWACTAAVGLGLAATPWLLQQRQRLPKALALPLDSLALLGSWRALLGPLALSLVVQALSVVIVFVLSKALRLDLSVLCFWMVVPMVSLLTMLPVSFNGMVIREGSMVVLLTPLGATEAQALTLGLLWFTVQVAVSLMGGLVYMSGRWQRPAPLDARQDDHGPVDRDSDQGRTGEPRAAA